MKLNEISGSFVWVIAYENYDDTRIMGIFTSEAAAYKASKNMKVPEGEYKGAAFITDKDVTVKQFPLNKVFTTYKDQSLS